MIFDLISNKGKIIAGTTSFNDSFYSGKIITKNEEQSYYIDNSLYTVLSIHLPEELSHEMLLFNLDIMGVACSGGSACASGGQKGSHVFSAIMPESKRLGIRFSFSKYTSKEDIDFAVDKLKQLFV